MPLTTDDGRLGFAPTTAYDGPSPSWGTRAAVCAPGPLRGALQKFRNKQECQGSCASPMRPVITPARLAK